MSSSDLYEHHKSVSLPYCGNDDDDDDDCVLESGWDIFKVWGAYCFENDYLCFGLETYEGIAVGDADANGDQGGTSAALATRGGTDVNLLGLEEYVVITFDVTGDNRLRTSDYTIGVREDYTVFSCTNPSNINRPEDGGTVIPGCVLVSPGIPDEPGILDFEVCVANASAQLGLDLNAATIEIIFMVDAGSNVDDGIGAEQLGNRNNPKTLSIPIDQCYGPAVPSPSPSPAPPAPGDDDDDDRKRSVHEEVMWQSIMYHEGTVFSPHNFFPRTLDKRGIHHDMVITILEGEVFRNYTAILENGEIVPDIKWLPWQGNEYIDQNGTLYMVNGSEVHWSELVPPYINPLCYLTPTGNNSADFIDTLSTSIYEHHRSVFLPPTINSTGWDVFEIYMGYSPQEDKFCVGLSSYDNLAIGDADGDGDQGGTGPQLAALNGTDVPHLGIGEYLIITLNLHGASTLNSSDVSIGVPTEANKKARCFNPDDIQHPEDGGPKIVPCVISGPQYPLEPYRYDFEICVDFARQLFHLDMNSTNIEVSYTLRTGSVVDANIGNEIVGFPWSPYTMTIPLAPCFEDPTIKRRRRRRHNISVPKTQWNTTSSSSSSSSMKVNNNSRELTNTIHNKNIVNLNGNSNRNHPSRGIGVLRPGERRFP